jgi:D-alanyl-D-alanine carboxypeptidase
VTGQIGAAGRTTGRAASRSRKAKESGGIVSDCEPESSTSPDPPDHGEEVATPAAAGDPSTSAGDPSTSAGDPSSSVPEASRRGRKHPVIVWSSVALVVVLVASAGSIVAARIDSSLPQPTVAGRVSASVVPGSAPVQPWPARGQAAVAIPALGYAEQSGPETPVPIASLTKMTTAVVLLRDHPIPPGSSGPTITVTPDDAAQFGVDLSDDQTNIPLLPGETLTELQLLEALLIRSADDAAYTLAAWDAGSQQAFVEKMNVLALSLGALHSHYVDTSGFDPGSVSTAADTLRIAAAGMAIPAFASVAAMPSANVPGAGTIHNVVGAIGTDGLVGVKSGYTSEAAGCMVLAAYRFVGGRSVLVLASALGQSEPAPAPPPPTSPAPAVPTAAVPATTTTTAAPPATATANTTTTTTAPYSPLEAQYPLLYTEPIVEHLLDASVSAIVPVRVVTAGEAISTASTEWGGTARIEPVVAGNGAWLLGVPGQRVVATMAPSATKPDGVAAGAVRFTLGAQTETVPLRLVRRVPDPGWWWKILHN